MSEPLKNPEDYLEKFFSWKKSTDIGEAPRIEKKESRYIPGTGWYELHPFGVDIGKWNRQEDSLANVDIVAWNTESYDLARAMRSEKEQQAKEKNKKIHFPLSCILVGAFMVFAGIYLWYTPAPMAVALILIVSGIGLAVYGAVALRRMSRGGVDIELPLGW